MHHGFNERGLDWRAGLQRAHPYHCGGADSHGGYAEKVASGRLVTDALATGVAFGNERVSFVLGAANSTSRSALFPESQMTFRGSDVMGLL